MQDFLLMFIFADVKRLNVHFYECYQEIASRTIETYRYNVHFLIQ